MIASVRKQNAQSGQTKVEPVTDKTKGSLYNRPLLATIQCNLL